MMLTYAEACSPRQVLHCSNEEREKQGKMQMQSRSFIGVISEGQNKATSWCRAAHAGRERR